MNEEFLYIFPTDKCQKMELKSVSLQQKNLAFMKKQISLRISRIGENFHLIFFLLFLWSLEGFFF